MSVDESALIDPVSASKKVAFVTVATTNRLHMTRTLMQSVAAHHPLADRYCAIVDLDTAPAEALAAEFRCVRLTELNLPDGEDFYFRYAALELACALKPWALHFLLNKGYDVVVYLDSDTRVYGPFDDVVEAISNTTDIVIMPHLLTPLHAASRPTELEIRRAGIYNAGCCAVSARPVAEAFLKWWQSHLRYGCLDDASNGYVTDQGWVDLVPGLFQNVLILRHSGYNVAYWNMAQRPLTRDGDDVLAGGDPLVFFHFSGFDTQRPEAISRFLPTTEPVSKEVIQLAIAYRSELEANGEKYYGRLPYCFDTYSDGTPILISDRIQYRTTPKLRQQIAGAPFSARAAIRPHSEPTPQLDDIYAFLLGRQPDEMALENYRNFPRTPIDHRRLARAVARSPEARSRPGWRLRLMLWPFRRYLHYRRA